LHGCPNGANRAFGYDRLRVARRPIARDRAIADICELLRAGVRREAACARVGIAASTLWRWCEHSDQVLAQIKAAEAEAECLVAAVVYRAAAQGYWKASAWLLEHHPRWRQAWGNHAPVEDDPRARSVDPLYQAHALRQLLSPEASCELAAALASLHATGGRTEPA
jgi:hypothetical protein